MTSPTPAAAPGAHRREPTPEVALLADAAVASTLLKPLRLRVLEELAEPASATELAGRLGLPRQRLNYHVRELERAGLVRCVEERRKGNCVERLYRSAARHYLISPSVLGAVAPPPPDPAEAAARDRLSWSYLVSLLGKAVRELAGLRSRADRAGQRLATWGLQSRVRFASPAELDEFQRRLAAAIAELAAEYHHSEGRGYELLVASYPTPKPDRRAAQPEGRSEQAGGRVEQPERRSE